MKSIFVGFKNAFSDIGLSKAIVSSSQGICCIGHMCINSKGYPDGAWAAEARVSFDKAATPYKGLERIVGWLVRIAVQRANLLHFAAVAMCKSRPLG